MKRLFMIVPALLALLALLTLKGFSDNLLGANQYIRITSSNHIEKAWTRSVVMQDGKTGKIIGDEGVVASGTTTKAVDTAASNCVWISMASIASMTNSMNYLYAHTNEMAEYCVEIAMHLQPETVRSNLTSYVVRTETIGNIDYQDVWYNRVLLLKPRRYVTYASYCETNNVKCEWINWTTNGVDVTDINGKVWSGCHRCKVQRPAFAQNVVCLDYPNDLLGKYGMNWGDMLLRMDNKDLFTGFVTNGVTGEVIYFNNGFYCETPEGAE